MSEIVITFGGPAFNALRPDQKLRVSQMMMSWRAWGGFWYDRAALRRAIRKV